MNKKELLEKCKALGIEATEELTNKELKALISEKEAELAEIAEKEKVEKLTEKAKALELETTGKETSAELEELITEKLDFDEFLAKAQNLGLGTKSFKTSSEIKTAVAKQEQKLADIKAEEEKEAAKIYKDDRGIEWRFKDDAPKTINIDGRPMTQSEILESEDVISELAYGNSNFLTRKNL